MGGLGGPRRCLRFGPGCPRLLRLHHSCLTGSEHRSRILTDLALLGLACSICVVNPVRRLTDIPIKHPTAKIYIAAYSPQNMLAVLADRLKSTNCIHYLVSSHVLYL